MVFWPTGCSCPPPPPFQCKQWLLSDFLLVHPEGLSWGSWLTDCFFPDKTRGLSQFLQSAGLWGLLSSRRNAAASHGDFRCFCTLSWKSQPVSSCLSALKFGGSCIEAIYIAFTIHVILIIDKREVCPHLGMVICFELLNLCYYLTAVKWRNHSAD